MSIVVCHGHVYSDVKGYMFCSMKYCVIKLFIWGAAWQPKFMVQISNLIGKNPYLLSVRIFCGCWCSSFWFLLNKCSGFGSEWSISYTLLVLYVFWKFLKFYGQVLWHQCQIWGVILQFYRWLPHLHVFFTWQPISLSLKAPHIFVKCFMLVSYIPTFKSL